MKILMLVFLAGLILSGFFMGHYIGSLIHNYSDGGDGNCLGDTLNLHSHYRGQDICYDRDYFYEENKLKYLEGDK